MRHQINTDQMITGRFSMEGKDGQMLTLCLPLIQLEFLAPEQSLRPENQTLLLPHLQTIQLCLHSSLPFVTKQMPSSVALLVYSKAKLISRFMADLQPNRQTEKMATALSLLSTQGLLNEGINACMSTQTTGLFDQNKHTHLYVYMHAANIKSI